MGDVGFMIWGGAGNKAGGPTTPVPFDPSPPVVLNPCVAICAAAQAAPAAALA